ncbi:hypothetical protein ABWH89_04910 [Hoeflea alexandrii]|uniref:hypothetical protein n=1 Tax=Hoeflea alexandrii TaxID=288436 RepID=UPI0035CEB3A2
MMSGTATAQMAVLEALKNGKPASLDTLDRKLDAERRYIVKSTTCLIYSGLIERMEMGVYRITDAGRAQLDSGEPIRSGKTGRRPGVRRARAGSLRQRIWTAMRQFNAGGVSKAFSLPDLLTIALNEGEETPSTYNNAGQYIRWLKKTGYLLTLTRRQTGTRPGSNGFVLFKLVRDSGEQSPAVRLKQREVFDPNTREVFKW